MHKYVGHIMALLALAACETAAPSVVRHPLADHVIVDDFKIYVVPQAGNVWVASGGEEGKDGLFIQYRQKRAIEVQSKCRIKRVLSKPGQPLLKASVHQCRK